jgi:cytochrome oxidase Cu insertion factor (SCO1/SenC/PrrC family)
MARISLAEAQAWVEATKFTITTISSPPNSDMLVQLEEEVLARVASVYDTTTWVDATTTPRLIRVAIAKLFVAWAYRRQYSESVIDSDAEYAMQLEGNAELIIAGIVDGSIEIPGLPGSATNSPAFYPNDASSAMEPTFDDPSLGPAAFSMGQVF